jgi:hypothetical protein
MNTKDDFQTSRLTLAFGTLSALIFGISLVVHILTIVPNSGISMDSTWYIHVAIFIPAGAAIVRLSFAPRVLKTEDRSFFQRYADQYTKIFQFLRRLPQLMPKRFIVLGIILILYVLINFLLFLGHSWNGSPTEMNGRYYLNNHGQYTEITEQEYKQYQAYEVRGFSGHWMFFSYFGLVYFLFVDRRLYSASRQTPVKPTTVLTREPEKVKSNIGLYWCIWIILVVLLLLARFTVFRHSPENARFILFTVYAVPTWLSVMILNLYEGSRLNSHLRKYHSGSRISPLSFLFSKDDLGDRSLGELRKNYRRFIALVLTIFFSIPVLFLATMLF